MMRDMSVLMLKTLSSGFSLAIDSRHSEYLFGVMSVSRPAERVVTCVTAMQDTEHPRHDSLLAILRGPLPCSG